MFTRTSIYLLVSIFPSFTLSSFVYLSPPLPHSLSPIQWLFCNLVPVLFSATNHSSKSLWHLISFCQYLTQPCNQMLSQCKQSERKQAISQLQLSWWWSLSHWQITQGIHSARLPHSPPMPPTYRFTLQTELEKMLYIWRKESHLLLFLQPSKIQWVRATDLKIAAEKSKIFFRLKLKQQQQEEQHQGQHNTAPESVEWQQHS